MSTEKKGNVRIVCGPNEETFPGLAGRTIASVRGSLKTPFGIDPTAQPRLSNHTTGEAGVLIVNENHTLKEGDTLEFVRPTGQKGNGEEPTLGDCYKQGKKIQQFFNAGRMLLNILRILAHG